MAVPRVVGLPPHCWPRILGDQRSRTLLETNKNLEILNTGGDVLDQRGGGTQVRVDWRNRQSIELSVLIRR